MSKMPTSYVERLLKGYSWLGQSIPFRLIACGKRNKLGKTVYPWQVLCQPGIVNEFEECMMFDAEGRKICEIRLYRYRHVDLKKEPLPSYSAFCGLSTLTMQEVAERLRGASYLLFHSSLKFPRQVIFWDYTDAVIIEYWLEAEKIFKTAT